MGKRRNSNDESNWWKMDYGTVCDSVNVWSLFFRMRVVLHWSLSQ